MIAPLLLLILSLLGLIATLTQPGLQDFALLAVPCVVGSLILLGRAWWSFRAPGTTATKAPAKPGFRIRRGAADRFILIDGSNVLYWKDNTPDIDTLRAVIAAVTARGYTPGVVFDATAGYRISGRYQHDNALGDLLTLPEDQVMVVQKGSPTDPVLLAAARDLGAQIITNDRYRDWADAHPEVRNPGLLVRGAWRDGKLWLDLEEMAVV